MRSQQISTPIWGPHRNTLPSCDVPISEYLLNISDNHHNTHNNNIEKIYRVVFQYGRNKELWHK